MKLQMVSLNKKASMGIQQAKDYGYKAHETGKRRDWKQDRNFVLAIPLELIEQKSPMVSKLTDAWAVGWDEAYHKGYQDEMSRLNSKQAGEEVYKVIGVHNNGMVEVLKFDTGSFKLRVPPGTITVSNKFGLDVEYGTKVVLDGDKKTILKKIGGKKLGEVVKVLNGEQDSEAVLKSRGIKWEKRTMPRGKGKEIVWWFRGVPVAYWNSISKGLVMGERGTESFAKRLKKIKEARDSFDIVLENNLKKIDENLMVRDLAVWRGGAKVVPINRVDSIEYTIWKVKDKLGIKPNIFKRMNKKWTRKQAESADQMLNRIFEEGAAAGMAARNNDWAKVRFHNEYAKKMMPMFEAKGVAQSVAKKKFDDGYKSVSKYGESGTQNIRELKAMEERYDKKDLFVAQVTNGTAWEVRNRAVRNMPVARFDDKESAEKWLRQDLRRLNIFGEYAGE